MNTQQKWFIPADIIVSDGLPERVKNLMRQYKELETYQFR
jgi:hypothetical protein